ncbi:hypothetical protein [Croceitalea rosinachiae]|uniref:Uncharacterized protein n=1 Tax=Croceitalea rosinachiae TaxID=3075596 RepID=A0ABU3A9Q2_9FLAO|nr:hypothetical protein [Croceitalea sp. F388]MDT0606904.1 hypothetical protein [Croceitalea sp. F388]
MASIRDLKKDINFVLGDIIEAVYQWEAATNNKNSEEGSALVDKAIDTFDYLMDKVNTKAEDKKAHFKSVRTELETKATELVEKLNALGS